MSLDDIVQVSITATTASPTRVGFGTPLILAYHTRWTSDLVREYASLAEMVSDSFATTDPAYLCATKIFSQNPRVRKVKVGRRTRAFTQTIDITPVTTTVGFVYRITVGALEATYTVITSDTVALICAGLVTAINALANTALHTATNNTTKVTFTTPAGTLVDLSAWTDAPNMLVEDKTADPGIATDIADCVAEDDDWYGLVLDSNSQAEVAAAAADVETRLKMFAFNTSDDECFDSGDTNDVFSSLKTLNLKRTIGIFSHRKLLSYAGAAWIGNRFPYSPGSDTWKFKTLSGVATDNLSSGRVNAIAAKRGNVYTEVAGLSITQEGKMFSGEWADVVRFIDWLQAEIKVRVFTQLVNNQKVPYTDLGVDIIKAAIQGALDAGVLVGGLSSNPSPYVTAPVVADVDATTKGTRVLPDVKFFGTLAGAIHATVIAGTLSV